MGTITKGTKKGIDMPCFCDPDKEEIDEARLLIRKKAQEICNIIHRVSHPTDRYPLLLRDSMKLLEHLYTGECDEKTN